MRNRLFLMMSTASAQYTTNLPNGLRTSCGSWEQNSARVQYYRNTRAARGCLDQIDLSTKACHDISGPSERDLTNVVSDPGMGGAAMAQARVYAGAKKSFEDQVEHCENGKSAIKKTCGTIYQDVVGVRRENQDEVDSAQSESSETPYEARSIAFDKIQQHRQVDLELQQDLGDTRAAEAAGVKTMNDLITCYVANAKIYGETFSQAQEKSIAIDDNREPRSPDDQRTEKERREGPLKEAAKNFVGEKILSIPLGKALGTIIPKAPAGIAAGAAVKNYESVNDLEM